MFEQGILLFARFEEEAGTVPSPELVEGRGEMTTKSSEDSRWESER